MPTQEEYNIHQTSTRQLFIRIDLLDFSTENKIGEIQGNCTDGSVDIDAFSNIRRTTSVSLIVTDSSFLISEDSKIWLNKKIRITFGLMNILTNDIVWINDINGGCGIFVISNPTISYDTTQKLLSFNALDLMCLLDGTLSGQLGVANDIPLGTPISTAIRSTVTTLGGVNANKTLIDDIVLNGVSVVTPYDIKNVCTDTVFSVLSTLNNLYMNYEMFFSENGYFIFQMIKKRLNDPIIYDFSVSKDLTVNYKIEPDFTNIKNHVKIWGRVNTDGTQVMSEIYNTDVDSPFNTTKLPIRTYSDSIDTLYTQDQADSQSLFELFKRSNFNEKISISCVPVYFLGVNKIVNFNVPEIGLIGKYLITKITTSLKFDTLQTFEGYKIYS